jgi:hypothetical protein
MFLHTQLKKGVKHGFYVKYMKKRTDSALFSVHQKVHKNKTKFFLRVAAYSMLRCLQQNTHEYVMHCCLPASGNLNMYIF